jgi:uncharacterized protein YceH (UPF0502 family)
MHLLSGDVALEAQSAGPAESLEAASDVVSTRDRERIEQLETEVAELRRELETLREQFASFQKQFQ